MKKANFKVVCINDRAYLSSDGEGNPRRPRKGERLTGSLTIGKVYEVFGEDLGM